MAKARVMMIIIDNAMTGTVKDEIFGSASNTESSFVRAFSWSTFLSLYPIQNAFLKIFAGSSCFEKD